MNKEKVYSDLHELLKNKNSKKDLSVENRGNNQTDKNKVEFRIEKDASMKNYTSFRVGGPADILVQPGHAEGIVRIIKYLTDENIPYVVMGNGSNIIFRDGGFRGAVVLTGSDYEKSNMMSSVIEGNVITAGAGLLLSALSKIAAANSLSGMEFASGIPGSLGGALFMNAGAYGGEMKDIVSQALVYDPKTNRTNVIKTEDMNLSYRSSSFQINGNIILEITLQLTRGKANDITKRMKELTKKRNERQPVNMPSAGSFFKRPEGYYAGKLIEDSGLRGLRKGGAQISELHSGFMVNTGGATSGDIEDLMQVVRAVVYDKFGVNLEPEVRIMGEYK